MHILISTLIKELHQYAKNHQYQRAVVGVSGGLDSALALYIATRSFGPKNVTALILPEIGLTPGEDIDHAKLLAEHFDTQSFYQPINNFLVDYNFVTWDKSESANERLKARTRSLLLKHYSEAHNALLIGTANKSDLALGFGSRDAEFTGDLLLLGDLYKTEIMELAEAVQLPKELLAKESSRCLKPHQTDETELGATWKVVDDILKEAAKGVDPESMIEKGMDSLMVHKVIRLLQQNGTNLSRLPILQLGKLSASIKKAQAAEASSL